MLMSARGRVEEDAVPGRQDLAGADLEPALQDVLEMTGVVIGEGILLVAEEPPDHRILSADELDHQLRSELAQPLNEVVEDDVRAEDDVMDERETEDELGAASRRQRLPLGTAPPEPRRRVGE